METDISSFQKGANTDEQPCRSSCVRELDITIHGAIDRKPDMETMTLKEKSAFVAGLLQYAAATRNIGLKLRKKKG